MGTAACGCPKCGRQTNAIYRYCAGAASWPTHCLVGHDAPRGEHIDWCCGNCGYAWHEPTADRAPAPTKETE